MDPRPWSTHHPCCVDCGTTERPYYARGRCLPCYSRNYYREHREERHAQAYDAYHADPELAKDRVRAWRAQNPERQRQHDREYRQRNKERLNAQAREQRLRQQQPAAAGMAEGDVAPEWHLT